MKKLTYLLLALTMAFTVSCSSAPAADIAKEDVDYTNYTTYESPNGYSLNYSSDWYAIDVTTFEITTPDGTVIDNAQFQEQFGFDPSYLSALMNGVDAFYFSLADDGSFVGTTNVITMPNSDGIVAKDLEDPQVAEMMEQASASGLALSGLTLTVDKPAEFYTLGSVSYIVVEGTTEMGHYLSIFGIDDANVYTVTSMYSDADPDYKEKVTNLLTSITAN